MFCYSAKHVCTFAWQKYLILLCKISIKHIRYASDCAKHVAYATCVASFDTDFVFVLLLYASMLASEDAINFYAMILLFVLLFYKSTNTKSFKLGHALHAVY